MAYKSNNTKGARKDLLLQRRWVVPTLPSEPTTSTWAWNDNGHTVYFRIGEQVRVVDGEQSSGYQFWKLYDIKPNGDRIWAPINSCAVSIHIFRVIENNYNSGHTAVGAARIGISCADDDRNLSFTWQGNDVSYYLMKNTTYRCVPEAVQNYETPEQFDIVTKNSDAARVIHEIVYNHKSERIEVKFSKTNDTDIESVQVSIIWNNSVYVTKDINLTSDIYALLGNVPLGNEYRISVAGSTDCWGRMLFSSYKTTARVASTSVYQLSLPFTDERVDVTVKHSTSNGEVFFDPEDVSDYTNYNIFIDTLLDSDSTYEGNKVNQIIYSPNMPWVHDSRIISVSADPRNTSVLQYKIPKYVLPGNYMLSCGSPTFRVFDTVYSNPVTTINASFYKIPSNFNQAISAENNTIDFVWELIYCNLKVSTNHAPSVTVSRNDSGSTFRVTKTPTGRTADFGMIPVPGSYSISFPSIPYTYKGVSTTLYCSSKSITLTPSSSKKRERVSEGEYTYSRSYTIEYDYEIDEKNLSIDMWTNDDEYGESLPSSYISNISSQGKHIITFTVYLEDGSTKDITVNRSDFGSGNSYYGSFSYSQKILKVTAPRKTGYTGGTLVSDGNFRYEIHINHA